MLKQLIFTATALSIKQLIFTAAALNVMSSPRRHQSLYPVSKQLEFWGRGTGGAALLMKAAAPKPRFRRWFPGE
jgi:hypothetical protein